MHTLAQTLFRRRSSAPFASWLARSLAAHRQRTQLAALDDRMLRDIGISRAEAWAEATRPIWDVPARWRVAGCSMRHD